MKAAISRAIHVGLGCLALAFMTGTASAQIDDEGTHKLTPCERGCAETFQKCAAPCVKAMKACEQGCGSCPRDHSCPAQQACFARCSEAGDVCGGKCETEAKKCLKTCK